MLPIEYVEMQWDPNGTPEVINWSSLIDLLVLFAKSGGSFAEMIPHARPRYALRPGEVEDLRQVEEVLRNLWAKYSPKSPKPNPNVRNIALENAAVDDYETQKDRLHQVLLNLMTTDEWRSEFPVSEHPGIERAREIVRRRSQSASSNSR